MLRHPAQVQPGPYDGGDKGRLSQVSGLFGAFDVRGSPSRHWCPQMPPGVV